jgi:hypothetical protein
MGYLFPSVEVTIGFRPLQAAAPSAWWARKWQQKRNELGYAKSLMPEGWREG